MHGCPNEILEANEFGVEFGYREPGKSWFLVFSLGGRPHFYLTPLYANLQAWSKEL